MIRPHQLALHVDDRDRFIVVLLHDLGNLGIGHVGFDGNQLALVHQVADQCGRVGKRQYKFLEGDASKEFVVFVDHIHGIEPGDGLRLFPDLIDTLNDRPVGAGLDQFLGHKTAGHVGVVAEEFDHPRPHFRVDAGNDLFADLDGEVVEDIGRVVGVDLLDDEADVGGLVDLQEGLARIGVEVAYDLGADLEGQQVQYILGFLAVEFIQQGGDIGSIYLFEALAYEIIVVIVQRLLKSITEVFGELKWDQLFHLRSLLPE